ncbi:hypothetical protein UXO11_22735 [Enterobacter wuhouensis]|uniref:hypothetical protein n=1 Tax=Enterobacter wuhouensis TaxID=2529381 RepID=UPI002FD4AA3D
MKRLTLAVLPLILSACTSSHPESHIDITRVKEADSRNLIAVRIDVPFNKTGIFDNSDSVDYLASVTTVDGKIVKKEHSSLPYGTKVAASVSNDVDGKQLVSLAVRHACRPEIVKFKTIHSGEEIDLPSQYFAEQSQKVLIKRGESILINGNGFNSSCAFPRIIVHPTE